jgi:Zn-dependent protease/predicted transcriptional regulator
MNGVPIARIFGFEIRLHLSWVFIIAVVTVTVAGRLSEFQPEIAPAVSWGVGLVGSLGFMLTVVAHELGHALMARRDGSESKTVVVQFIGSPAAVDVVASSPRAEALIALAGPVTSLGIGTALVAIALGVIAAAPWLGPVADVLFIIGALDLILAGVSMIPAFPLDGGRVVRAAAWARSGDARVGTRAAGMVGRLVGGALLVVGLAVIVVNSDPIDGVMIGLVGWFLMASARSVDRWLYLDGLVAGIRVDEAMEPHLQTLSPHLTLDTFAAGILDGSVGPALPVVHDDAVVGIVGATQVRRVAQRDWASTRTEDVMVGPPDLPTTSPDESLTVALERLRTSHLDGLPVLDGAALRGVLTRRSIAAILHARAEAAAQAL